MKTWLFMRNIASSSGWMSISHWHQSSPRFMSLNSNQAMRRPPTVWVQRSLEMQKLNEVWLGIKSVQGSKFFLIWRYLKSVKMRRRGMERATPLFPCTCGLEKMPTDPCFALWFGRRQPLLPANWLSDNAFVYGSGRLRFKSRAGQIGHSVANGSPPLRYFFERSCFAYRSND